MLELGYKTANDWRPQIRFDSESARGGGRVKRRSPRTIGNLLSLYGTAALLRLRCTYSKCNRITSFPQSSDFSHGCAGRPARSTVTEQVDRGSVNRASSYHREDPCRLPGWPRTADNRVGMRKTMIVALARKLIIALWRFVTTGEPLEGVVLRPAA